MYKYIDNETIKKELDKLLIDIGISKVELSKRMECKPQQLNNILNKQNLSFGDMKRIYNALGYDLYIDIRPRDNGWFGLLDYTRLLLYRLIALYMPSVCHYIVVMHKYRIVGVAWIYGVMVLWCIVYRYIIVGQCQAANTMHICTMYICGICI